MAIPSWITVNPTSGSGNKNVSITAQKNTGATDRSGTVTVVTAGGISKIISIIQKGSQGHLEWLSQPLWEVNLEQSDYVYSSSQVQIKNLSDAYNLESVVADVFQVNGEEVSPSPTINYFDNDNLGMEISMSIDSYDNANKIANVTFDLKITDYALLKEWLDIRHNGSGSSDDPYYGTLTIQIMLSGLDGQEVYSDYIDLSIYEPVLYSELTLNPESNHVPLEGSAEFQVDYYDMLGGTITFNPGTEMQNSDGAVYMGGWTGDISSDPSGKDNGGTITFSIFANSEASAGTYTFEITGRNSNGETFSAPGEVDVS
jgi:hypothetical protein